MLKHHQERWFIQLNDSVVGQARANPATCTRFRRGSGSSWGFVAADKKNDPCRSTTEVCGSVHECFWAQRAPGAQLSLHSHSSVCLSWRSGELARTFGVEQQCHLVAKAGDGQTWDWTVTEWFLYTHTKPAFDIILEPYWHLLANILVGTTTKKNPESAYLSH